MRWGMWPLLAASIVLACKSDDEPFDVCDAPDQAKLAALPAQLSQTGLYADIKTYAIAPGVMAFRPQFALWSDGAEKKRWISLPAGGVIDTHDMDHWSLPQGTRIWKEFARGGHRIETRVLSKNGATDADWVMQSYVWNADQTEATATPEGRDNAYEDHEVPAAAKCKGCHGGRPGRVLGFSAIQLAPSAQPGEIGLADLVAKNLLSQPPAGPLDVPGDPVTKAALGYLHANCSHCHNQARPPREGARCYDPQKSMDFTLAVAQLATPDDTPTYKTVIGHQIKRGDPDGSKVLQLDSTRGDNLHMPPLATKHVDDAAVANLREWISKL